MELPHQTIDSEFDVITAASKRNFNFWECGCMGKYRRYIILFVLVSTISLFGSAYCGWQFFVHIFSKENLYGWLCDESSMLEDGSCAEQKNAVQFLFTIAIMMNYALSPVAAAMSAWIGPRYTGLVGCLMMSGGWLLLSFSTQKLQLYVHAFVLIGGATDFFNYPSFSLLRLFPNREGSIVGALYGSTAISWWIPGLFYTSSYVYGETSSYIFMLYGVLSIPMFVVFLISLPVESYKLLPEEFGALTVPSKEEKDVYIEVPMERAEEIVIDGTSIIEFDVMKVDEVEERVNMSDDISTACSIHTHSNVLNCVDECKGEAKKDNWFIKRCVDVMKEKVISSIKLLSTQPIFKTLISFQYLLLLTISTWGYIRFSFVISAMSDILGNQYGLALAYIAPVSVVSYLYNGVVADRLGVYYSFYLINTLNTLLYGLLLIACVYQNAILTYGAICLYPLSGGNPVAIVSYIVTYFGHIKNYSSLIAVSYIIAAVAMYVPRVMYSTAVTQYNGDFFIIMLSMTVVNVLSFAGIGALQYFYPQVKKKTLC